MTAFILETMWLKVQSVRNSEADILMTFLSITLLKSLLAFWNQVFRNAEIMNYCIFSLWNKILRIQLC